MHPSRRDNPWRVLALCVSLMAAACSPDDGSTSGGTKGGSAGDSASTVSSEFGNSNTAPAGGIGAATADPVATGGKCAAGHYVGTFTGMYRSAAWGNGTTELVVTAQDSGDMPGLEFWLEQSTAPCADGQEFCPEFDVSGGKMHGFANPFSSGDPNDPALDPNNPASLFAIKVPFDIDLNGALDCTRGQLMLTLDNGTYDVATVLYHFGGTAEGKYDHASSSVIEGVWAVKEEQPVGAIWPADANIGGEGTWEAHLEKM